MHQDRYLKLLLTSNALFGYISSCVVMSLNTSIQPYDRDLAFRCCYWNMSQVLYAEDVFATRLHTG